MVLSITMMKSVLDKLKLPPTKEKFSPMGQLEPTSMGKAEADVMLLFFGKTYNSRSDTYVKTEMSKKIGSTFARLCGVESDSDSDSDS